MKGNKLNIVYVIVILFVGVFLAINYFENREKSTPIQNSEVDRIKEMFPTQENIHRMDTAEKGVDTYLVRYPNGEWHITYIVRFNLDGSFKDTLKGSHWKIVN